MPITNTTIATVSNGDRQRCVMAFSTTPAATGDALADVAASDFDALMLGTLGITIKNSGANSATYQVVGGNLADFSDAVVVQTPSGTPASGTIAAGAIASFAAYFIPFRYYKVQARSTSAGNPATLAVNVLGRPT